MKYKLLCVDVDGTLADKDKVISDKNKQALKKIYDAGMKIAIASGRSRVSIQSLFNQLDIPCNGICLNGAYIEVNGVPIKNNPLSNDGVTLAYQIVKKHKTSATFSTPTLSIRNHDVSDAWKKQLEEGSLKADFVIAKDDEDYKKLIWKYNKDIVKVSILENNQEKYNVIRKEFEDVGIFSVSMSDVDYVDITVKGCNKGSAVKELAEYFDIPISEVVSIGDNENDIEMLKITGLSIAMGNAVKALKDIADVVTDDNNNHGVAKAIEKYILGEPYEELEC